MKINNETKIGIMVTLVLIGLAVFTFKTGDFNFSKKGYTVKVQFQNIDGVSTNAPVMVNGLEIGQVKDIDIVERNNKTVMELTVRLEPEARLHEGAKAYVRNMGFMGEKYVGLTTGDVTAPYLTEGDVIVGEEPTDFGAILREGEAIAVNLKEISANINERLAKNKEAVDNIIADLEKTMGSLSSVSARVDESLSDNKKDINAIISNLKSATANLDLMTYDLKENPWKLMYRSKQNK